MTTDIIRTEKLTKRKIPSGFESKADNKLKIFPFGFHSFPKPKKKGRELINRANKNGYFFFSKEF